MLYEFSECVRQFFVSPQNCCYFISRDSIADSQKKLEIFSSCQVAVKEDQSVRSPQQSGTANGL